MIAEKHNLVYLSTGEMLLEEIGRGTEIGKVAKPIIDRGELVSDEVVITLIEKHIQRNPKANGFIFKGFPRTIVQAYILDGLLRKINSSVSFIINIDLPTLDLIKRLDERGKTDRQRSYDVNTATIVQRLEEHEKKSQPLVEYYSRQRDVCTIDGAGTSDEVFARISGPVEEAWRKVR